MYRRVLTAAVTVLFVMNGVYAQERRVQERPAQEREGVYEDLKIKSRAKRDYTNRGTTRYKYFEVDEYSDDLDPEEDLGVLDIKKSRIRDLHTRVKVHGDVESEKENLEIGTITVRDRGSVGHIDQKVTIEGGISANSENVEVGGVRIRNRRIDRIETRTEIGGRVHAR